MVAWISENLENQVILPCQITARLTLKSLFIEDGFTSLVRYLEEKLVRISSILNNVKMQHFIKVPLFERFIRYKSKIDIRSKI